MRGLITPRGMFVNGHLAGISLINNSVPNKLILVIKSFIKLFKMHLMIVNDSLNKTQSLYRALILTSRVGYGAAKRSAVTVTFFVAFTGTISKLNSKRDKIIFISIIANFCPMQFLEPALNGIKANGWRLFLSREFDF